MKAISILDVIGGTLLVLAAVGVLPGLGTVIIGGGLLAASLGLQSKHLWRQSKPTK